MQNITTSNGLKEAIQLLEQERIERGELLKAQFQYTYEGFKPVNLFKKTLSEAVNSPHLVNDIVITILGLTTGYFSKKLIIGTSGSLVKKLLGSILQLGITKIIVNNPNAFKSFGSLIGQIFTRKKRNQIPDDKF